MCNERTKCDDFVIALIMHDHTVVDEPTLEDCPNEVIQNWVGAVKVLREHFTIEPVSDEVDCRRYAV